jgi:hypothetical protein
MIKQGIVPAENTINWWSEIPESSFTAATQYLGLLTSLNKALEITDRLRDADFVRYQQSGAILRAAGLLPLQGDDKLVQQVMRAIDSKEHIPYPLLVQTRRQENIHIADGYAVISAAYHLNPERNIPAIIAPWDYE